MPKRTGPRLTTPTNQRSLDPGSQDAATRKPPSRKRRPPLTTPGGGDLSISDSLSINRSTTTPPPTPPPENSCAGRPAERVSYQHNDPAALIQHLQIFLAHRGAADLVMTHGVTHVNTALAELPHAGRMKNPAGWLTWRVRRLAQGAAPLTNDTAQNPRRYLDEFHRRRGRLPWEPQTEKDVDP